MDNVIGEDRIAECVRTSAVKVQRWRERGKMPKHFYDGDRIVYDIGQIDEWLATNCRFVEVDNRPTVERILVLHSVRILLTREVLVMVNRHYSMCESTLYNKRNADAWPTIVLPDGEYRYFLSHIITIAQPVEPVAAYTVAQVEHIFGIGRTEICKLLQRGELKALPHRGGNSLSVTKDSVISFLKKCLPPGHNPYMWLNARLASTYPLLSPNKIAKEINARTPLRIRKLAAKGAIPSIQIDGHERRIPAEAISLIVTLLRSNVSE